MYIKNSSISGCSPLDVIPNMSVSSTFFQRRSFYSSWDFGLSVISGVVDKHSTSIKICSLVEIKIPAFVRIPKISLILMSTFESMSLVGRSCFTQGLVPRVLTVPKIFYVFLRNYLLIKQICDLKTTH